MQVYIRYKMKMFMQTFMWSSITDMTNMYKEKISRHTNRIPFVLK